MNSKTPPSMEAWLKEAKAQESAPGIGMYLVHNGTVRQSARAMVRENAAETRPVCGMLFSHDPARLDAAVSAIRMRDGIHYVRVWMNDGRLNPGDDIMYILIGGDIRPRVMSAMDDLLTRIKNECVTETEIYE